MTKKKVQGEDFITRKLRVINEMANQRKAKYLAERVMRNAISNARSKQNEEM